MIPLLALEDVSVRRGTSQVLDGLTLRVNAGENVALVGPSGGGKSTIVRLLLGLLAPERGTVRIRGEVASQDGHIGMPPEARDIAVVFQDLALWPHLAVAGNLRFVLRSRRDSREREAERIEHMLTQVGLAEKAGRYPGELSGGEQQRVAMARALVTSPSAVLLDEPLANLDVALKAELLDLLLAVLGTDTTAVYLTHDPREAARLSQHWAVLERGQIVQEDGLGALRRSPATAFVERMVEDLPGP
jgi:iron(III) transport system ATP-binding protein